VRPEKLRIAAEPPPAGSWNCAAGTVWDIGYLGNMSVYKVRLDNGTTMKAAVANASPVVARPIGWNDRVWVSWAPDAGLVLTR
jgi:putrescine transport system ATP-binding protein